ncbi:beta-1,3-galactosyltransferase 4-like isoform X2 [Leguminivora glycinivorella]|uniref:beta-1,3-galactosyltransferase 4-like isoform X2 n=1 Tax=Leguminivora glycinivorella TaxID=1035111 RepID=UPI00200EFC85|nr:beta-1,3-galactosyltransferase 4-like isoform X2 [Leguminivora glycinivorella]XP_048006375.1 beta-1,3-galactosyltransferase 4-like isoform X2 [Leguminivora glycinivorella]XP_048006376.1 beta-1,3-galactosyltransferase 4-like isoform X2 [Leguminivora glycinivorella]XP_048006377.1 beta-1,3-galactosyltransferase 4-like isoform X2 [Leguminivora glycinivorella]
MHIRTVERSSCMPRDRGKRYICAILLLIPMVMLVLLIIYNLENDADDFEEVQGQKWVPRALRMRSRYTAGYRRAHGELCQARGARVRLVVLVASAPAHAAERDAVRATWARAARPNRVALAFLLGASPPHLRDAILREDSCHRDLIEARFVDAYHNLPLKSLSMLEWFATYCPLAPHLFKTDDDMFVNIEQLLLFIEEHNTRNTIWGQVLEGVKVVRDERFKYSVPEAEHPGARFPPYATGHGYLVSGDAVPALRAAALGARFVRLEDVFMGVVARRAGVRVAHAAALALALQAGGGACAARRALVAPARPHEQYARWAMLQDPDIAC